MNNRRISRPLLQGDRLANLLAAVRALADADIQASAFARPGPASQAVMVQG